MPFTESPSGWTGQATSSAPDGTDIAEGTGKSLSTTVTGPGMLSFWWRAPADSFTEKFLWDIDKIIFGYITKQDGWRRVEQAIPAGTRTIRWRVWRPESNRLPTSALQLDQVSFIPSSVNHAPNDWLARNGLTTWSQDQDGVPAILEYAFNLDPASFGALTNAQGRKGDLPAGRIHAGARGDRLVLKYLRRKGSSLSYRPKFSGNLHDWTFQTHPPSILDLGDGWEEVTVHDMVEIPRDGGRFGAVEVLFP